MSAVSLSGVHDSAPPLRGPREFHPFASYLLIAMPGPSLGHILTSRIFTKSSCHALYVLGFENFSYKYPMNTAKRRIGLMIGTKAHQ